MPPAQITAARFAAAVRTYREARRRAYTSPEVAAHHIALETALAEVNRLAAVILRAPARTPAALRLKAAALAWEIEGEEPDGFTLDAFRAKALRGLLADLAARR